MAKVILDTETGEMTPFNVCNDIDSTIGELDAIIDRLNNFGVARQPSYDDLRMALYRSLFGGDLM